VSPLLSPVLTFLTQPERPKRRHLIISEFIQACLDEETLLDEEGVMCFLLSSYASLTPPQTLCLRPVALTRLTCVVYSAIIWFGRYYCVGLFFVHNAYYLNMGEHGGVRSISGLSKAPTAAVCTCVFYVHLCSYGLVQVARMYEYVFLFFIYTCFGVDPRSQSLPLAVVSYALDVSLAFLSRLSTFSPPFPQRPPISSFTLICFSLSLNK
jgi:hypothetical protein